MVSSDDEEIGSPLGTALEEFQDPKHQLNALMIMLKIPKMDRVMILDKQQLGDVHTVCSPPSIYKLSHLKFEGIGRASQKALAEVVYYSTLRHGDELHSWTPFTFHRYVEWKKTRKWQPKKRRKTDKVAEFEKLVNFCEHSSSLDRDDVQCLWDEGGVYSLHQLPAIEHKLNRYDMKVNVMARRNQTVLGAMITYARMNHIWLEDYTAQDHLAMLEQQQEYFLDCIGTPSIAADYYE